MPRGIALRKETKREREREREREETEVPGVCTWAVVAGKWETKGKLPSLLEGSLVSALNATYRLEREPPASPSPIHRERGMNIYKKLQNSSPIFFFSLSLSSHSSSFLSLALPVVFPARSILPRAQLARSSSFFFPPPFFRLVSSASRDLLSPETGTFPSESSLSLSLRPSSPPVLLPALPLFRNCDT